MSPAQITHCADTVPLYLPSTCIAKQTIYKYPYVVKFSLNLEPQWQSPNKVAHEDLPHLCPPPPLYSTGGSCHSPTKESVWGGLIIQDYLFLLYKTQTYNSSSTKQPTLLRLWLELSDSTRKENAEGHSSGVAPRWNGQEVSANPKSNCPRSRQVSTQSVSYSTNKLFSCEMWLVTIQFQQKKTNEYNTFTFIRSHKPYILSFSYRLSSNSVIKIYPKYSATPYLTLLNIPLILVNHLPLQQLILIYI